MVWYKSRSNAVENALFDTARGAGNVLLSNTTAAQGTGYGQSFTSSGFSLTNGGTFYNGNGYTYASWTFRKAAKFFDVVTYVGDGVSGRQIAHNLGSVPGCMIVKSLTSGDWWAVYHRSLGGTKVIWLNDATGAITQSARWNDTDPTSTVFTVGSSSETNGSGNTYVAYLFAHDAGGFGDAGTDSVVKCGSFTASATGSASVDLGWEPQFIIAKASSTTGGWFMADIMRGWSLTEDKYVYANTSGAEVTNNPNYWNPSATGFTCKDYCFTPNSTVIYIAIRRGPMKTPTVGTEVFAANRATPSTGDSFMTNFPVDLSVANAASNGIIGYFQDRLRGYPTTSSTSGNYPLLLSTNTNAESAYNNSSPYIWGADSNAAVKYGSNLGGLVNTTYAFRRAPGFFDVVATTGAGTFGQKNHSLGVIPELIIGKVRTGSTTFNWAVYGSALGGKLGGLNTSNAFIDNWGPSGPSLSSTTFEPWADSSSMTFIYYLFATCPGVSKVGSYTGTGTTQQINCGFTAGARFVLIKRTDSTGDWYVWDSARGIVAGNDPYLLLNSTAAEVTSTDYVDTFSSGFEISSTAPAAINANGGSFIFLAIA